MDAGDVGVDTNGRTTGILVVEGVCNVNLVSAIDSEVVGGGDWGRVNKGT